MLAVDPPPRLHIPDSAGDALTSENQETILRLRVQDEHKNWPRSWMIW